MSENKNKICYLVNQYPKTSHTFIRREIQALEALGASVRRVSIRRSSEVLVNAEDQAELAKTQFIIDQSLRASMFGICLSFIAVLHKVPSCLKAYYQVCRAGGGSWIKHLIYLAEACWFYRFCKNHQITHVHAHFGTNPAEVAMYTRLLGGPSYSFTVHGPEEFDSPKQLSMGLKIRHAKAVVAITSYCRSQLFRWARVQDWNKVLEVHCAIDDSLLHVEHQALSQSRTLINIGRLCEQKGQMLLLKAFRQVVESHPDVKLHLVGDGELKPALQQYCQEHKLESAVIFEGWCDGKKIVELLDQSHGLVLPSFAEGLPVAIMEAFARRRPVITTYIAGIPELVTPENGWLVPAGSVELLTEAMCELLSVSPSVLVEKGNVGFQAVEKRHNNMTEGKTLLDGLGT